MGVATRTDPDSDGFDIYDQETGYRYEVIDGEVFVTPTSTPFHQTLTMELVASLDAVVHPERLGRIFLAPVELRLAEKVRLIPDLLFVSRDRREIVQETAIVGAPDLVVEIALPPTRQRDLGVKRNVYARHAIPEYWIVDPKSEDVIVNVLRGDGYVRLPNENGSARSLVLPGVAIAVAELFANAKAW